MDVQEEIMDAQESSTSDSDEWITLQDIESSTNNFIHDKNQPMVMKALALAIQFVQLIIMVWVCTESISNSQQWSGSLLGMLFVMVYYLTSIPGSLSIGIRIEMSEFTYDDFNTKLDGLPARILANVPVFIQPFISGLLSWALSFYFLIYYVLSKLLKCDFLKLVSSALEFALIIATTFAIVYVSNGQTSLIDLLVNFAGILVVLELDDKAGSAFDDAVIKVKKQPEKFNVMTPSIIFGLIIWIGILFACIRLATKE